MVWLGADLIFIMVWLGVVLGYGQRIKLGQNDDQSESHNRLHFALKLAHRGRIPHGRCDRRWLGIHRCLEVRGRIRIWVWVRIDRESQSDF